MTNKIVWGTGGRRMSASSDFIISRAVEFKYQNAQIHFEMVGVRKCLDDLQLSQLVGLGSGCPI